MLRLLNIGIHLFQSSKVKSEFVPACLWNPCPYPRPISIYTCKCLHLYSIPFYICISFRKPKFSLLLSSLFSSWFLFYIDHVDTRFPNLSQTHFDKPKVVSQSQSQKLTTWFSLKSQCPTTPPPTPPGKFQRSKIELYFQNKSC